MTEVSIGGAGAIIERSMSGVEEPPETGIVKFTFVRLYKFRKAHLIGYQVMTFLVHSLFCEFGKFDNSQVSKYLLFKIGCHCFRYNIDRRT